MITIIQSINRYGTEYVPNLGIANIIGALNTASIKSDLIEGQTQFIKELIYNSNSNFFDVLVRYFSNKKRKKEFDFLIHLNEGGKFLSNKKDFNKRLKEMYTSSCHPKDLTYMFKGNYDAFINLLLNIYLDEIFKREETLDFFNKFYLNRISNKTDQVGISYNIPKDERFIIYLSKIIKDKYDVPILVGGSHTAFMGDKSLFNLLKKSRTDFIIKYQAERPLRELLFWLESNKSQPRKIENLVFLSRNKLIKNHIGKCPNINEDSEPDFSKFQMEDFFGLHKKLPLLFSYGCAWGKCSFCCHSSIYRSSYSVMEKNRFVDRVQRLREEYGVRFFTLNDEFVPLKHIKNISLELINRNITDLNFLYCSRLSKDYKNEDDLKIIYSAGFRNIYWGLESGSQKILDLMNKGTDVKVNSEVLKTTHKNGLRNTCFVIFNFPGETKSDLMKTIKFLEDNNKYIDLLLPGGFSLYPNSRIAAQPDKFGIIISKSKRKDEGDLLKFKYGKDQCDKKTYSDILMKESMGLIRPFNNTFGFLNELQFGHSGTRMRLLEMSRYELSEEKYLDYNHIKDLCPLIYFKSDPKDASIIRFSNVKFNFSFNQRSSLKKRHISSEKREILELCDGFGSVKDIIQKADIKNAKEKVMNLIRESQDNNSLLLIKKLV